jgi:pyruvate kinase
MPRSRAQIVATLGPASNNPETILAMVKNGMDIARLNFSWGTLAEHGQQIKWVREAGKKLGMEVVVMGDLSGPRVQEGQIHTYSHTETSVLTDYDRECIAFGVKNGVDCFAMSFVGTAADVEACRAAVRENSGNQTVIAKIERAVALDHLDEIISAADAVMVARGDLGEEVPIEKIPFIQADIIRRANAAGKPVITATQMMLSMTESPTPTRAEVSDVSDAITEGSDAVMLSDETAKGKYPVEAVAEMEKIVSEAEKHPSAGGRVFNLLKKL